VKGMARIIRRAKAVAFSMVMLYVTQI